MLSKIRRSLFTSTSLVMALVVPGVLSVTPAEAVTLTFEGVAPPGTFVIPVTPYTEKGFTLTNLQGGSTDGIFDALAAGVNTNGTAIFGWCAGCMDGGNDIELTAVGGVPFSLSSLEAANLEAFGSTNQSIVVVGKLVGGGAVTQTLPLTDTWTTFVFSGFTSLARVDFFVGDAPPGGSGVPDPAFDNISMAAVPEPTTWLLLTTGLIGYGRCLRRTAEKISRTKSEQIASCGPYMRLTKLGGNRLHS